MSLPYGTMTDEEMRHLPIPSLSSPSSLLFLWVTARAIELGRELLTVWGFRRVDEVCILLLRQPCINLTDVGPYFEWVVLWLIRSSGQRRIKLESLSGRGELVIG